MRSKMALVLFATDFDGTLSAGGRIDEKTLRAAADFRSRGGLFGVCSGRDPESLKTELARHGLGYDYLILMNGARIEAGGKCLRERLLTGYQAALPLLRERCLFFTLLGDGEAYMYRRADSMDAVQSPGEQAYIDALRTSYALRDSADALQKAYQISCRTENGDTAVALADELGRQGLFAYPNIEYVDVVPADVGKANAVAAAAVHFGVSAAHVYTAGDGRNDMEMLSRYHGFAMEKAEHCVRSAAGRTVRSVGEALAAVCREEGL